VSDQPPPPPPPPPGEGGDPWDAWRAWVRGGGADGPDASPWDAWKSWSWDPRAARRFSSSTPSGCAPGLVRLALTAIVVLFLLSFLGGALGGGEDLAATELIARIDALEVTGPRDQRPPDASAGETATFPSAAAAPVVAGAIQAAQAPAQRHESGTSTFLLYEEATVAIQPAPGGSEVVVFDDNRSATRRFPLLVALPGWGRTLDDFDSRARSRGGIGGFRGGGGGFGK